ncbi:hypothetical protein SAMN05216198_3015 [Halopseudomonas litoralis]|uniref:Pre-peptidase C-terminal domain-containing protein n=1 Tax=Halopseudomonas litoralis TaxID=797277 RepID=A0A1H1VQT5_9GAMM|nr:hypothetical protein [Halopseudomonas litoralis]SDS87318.1 hypothetical protein SAMN05216198_3015 [Halopseudomonas litoralis]
MPFALRAVALPLASLAILLSGCKEPTAAVAPVVSEMPATLTGELSSQSEINLNDGSRSQSFELQLQGGSVYRVETSGALNQPVLLLLSEQGELISGPRNETLFLQPEKDGVYHLAVSGKSDRDFGPFRVELTSDELTSEGALELGAEILGQLQARSANNGNQYRLQIAEKGLYELVMRSTEFDTVLKLRGKDLNRTDDDGAGGTDSRVLTMLPEGSYQLTVGGIDTGDEGIYSLSFKRWEMPEGVTLGDGDSLKLGEETTGMLTGQPQTYRLLVEQSGLLQVNMQSDDIDSLLELTGAGISARDDDSGGGLDALLSVLVEPGGYRINAAQHGNGEGVFTLRTELIEVAQLGDRIAPGETRVGRLAEGQPTVVALQVEQAGRYRITLRSSNFDATLGLQGQGLEELDDDSAGGTNAQLELYLEAGEYQLINNTFGNEGAGNFVLSVSAPL